VKAHRPTTVAGVERPDWFLEDQYPFDSHWQEIDGTQVHYLDKGEGPALVMLHGNPTWSYLYRRMVPYLADRFRCIAIDYPGFGLSKARAGYGYSRPSTPMWWAGSSTAWTPR